ncbi:MAG: HPr family phosphocarrier protein [bacterium]|nr:HPr family phosphocarrier protein [bacterium]
MKTFTYVIQDEIGLHARPAGLLVKEAKKYSSQIIIDNGKKTAKANQLFLIMSLGIKHGEEVKITVEGEDEEIASKELELFFKENL